MRIVLFTIDDLFFVPTLLEPLLEARGHEIVATYVSRSFLSWKTLRRRGPFFLKNRYPFCIRPSDWARFLRKKLTRTRVDGQPIGSVVDFLRLRGFDPKLIGGLHNKEILAELKALDADVFLFFPFDKIAKKRFLSLPRLGVFNVHLGRLPERKGILGSFWALRFGDAEMGASLHEAVPEIDAGGLVAEARVPITTKSMYELMKTLALSAGPMVVEGLKQIESEAWTPIDISERSSGYYLYPELEDYRAFYARGCRLI